MTDRLSFARALLTGGGWDTVRRLICETFPDISGDARSRLLDEVESALHPDTALPEKDILTSLAAFRRDTGDTASAGDFLRRLAAAVTAVAGITVDGDRLAVLIRDKADDIRANAERAVDTWCVLPPGPLPGVDLLRAAKEDAMDAGDRESAKHMARLERVLAAGVDSGTSLDRIHADLSDEAAWHATGDADAGMLRRRHAFLRDLAQVFRGNRVRPGGEHPSYHALHAAVLDGSYITGYLIRMQAAFQEKR